MRRLFTNGMLRHRLALGLLPALAVLSLCHTAPASRAADAMVTLEADRMSLVDLARELTRQTGVLHRASGREAGRQRVVVFCRDQPAAAVRQATSDLLGWSWSEPAGPGKKTYTLVKGYRVRQHEAALRSRFNEEYGKLLTELAAAAGNEPGSPSDPLAPFLVSPSSRALLKGLSTLPEGQFRGLLAGKTVTGPFKAHTAEVRKLVGGVLAGEDRPHPARTVVEPTDTVQFGFARDAAGRPESLRLSSYRSGQLLLQFDAGHVVHAEITGRKLGEDPQLPRSPVLLKDRRFQTPFPVQPTITWPKPPEPAPTQIGWELRALSRRTPLPLMADCYPEMEATTLPFSQYRPPFPAPKLDGVSLRRALDRIEDEFFYDWNFRNEWVTLRYRRWYWEPLRKPATASTTATRN